MPDSANREREIFSAALERTIPTERAAFLDETCGGDANMRQRIESLLLAHDAAGRFLAGADSPAGPAPDGEAPILEGPGSQIDRYKLLEKIGEGGFGIVYMAEQQDPVRRRVALKIIKLGMDTRAVIARFEAERQALAMMDHPNIAKILDGGATESGRPYFVMELVRGVPLTTFCDEQRLAMPARLDLFMQVCHAVQHAHQKGVIHRDLKPSNILVVLHDDRPVPSVIDFGIAKATEQRLTEKTLFTRFHQFVGTPAYMSPEQAGVSGHDVDTRSDIYSLGVLLYELLAGRPPFDMRELLAAGYAEIQRTIREQDPPTPSNRIATLTREERTKTAEHRSINPARFVSEVRGDLDRIVMKCLQKDRTRRYDTANGLAMDLSRFLQNQPVLARPDGLSYRVTKFVRRHRGPVAFVALIFVVLVAGLTGTITQARRAEALAREAVAQRDLALRARSRAEAINDLNHFLLSDVAPQSANLTVGDLLMQAEQIVDRDLADSEENRVEILISIGRQYYARDMDARARQVLEKANVRAQTLADHSLRASAAATLASALARSGEFARANQLVQEALAELSGKPVDNLTQIYCLMRGSEVAREQGDSAAGVARAESASAIADRMPLGSALMKLTVAMELAEAYRMAGRNRDAAAAFERAWTQLTALGRERTEKASTLLNNWGLALFNLGRSHEAEPLFRRAVEISADVSGKHVSPMLLNNLARTLYDLGRSDAAVVLAERACAEARALHDEIVVNQSLLNLVRIYIDRDEIDRAQVTLDEAETLFQNMLPPEHYAFAAVLAQRAAIALARCDTDAALIAADQAMAIMETATQGQEYLPTYLIGRAEVQLRRRHLEEARVDAERALELEQAANLPGDFSIRVGRAWLILARALDALGEATASRSAHASALVHLRPCLGADHPQTREAAAGAHIP